MLEAVKQYIDELPNDSFDEYFNKYVCDIQDARIDNEVISTIRQNTVGVVGLSNLIDSVYDEVKLQ